MEVDWGFGVTCNIVIFLIKKGGGSAPGHFLGRTSGFQEKLMPVSVTQIENGQGASPQKVLRAVAVQGRQKLFLISKKQGIFCLEP